MNNTLSDAIASLIAAIIAFIGGMFIIVLLGAIMAFFAMLLWNWLMPVIFGLKTIGFLQAWGLIILSNIMLRSHSSTSVKKEKK